MLLVAATVILRVAMLTPYDLKCNALLDPLGLDTAAPLLSWRLSGTSAKSSAYQLQAASSRDLLLKGDSNIWDSHKVVDAGSNRALFRADAVGINSPCYWRVRVWDEAGNVSDWSDPAVWSRGPGSKWKAKWIQAADERLWPRMDQWGMKWFWKDRTALKEAPAETIFVRWRFHLDSMPTRATLLLTADNKFECWLNGHPTGASVNWEELTPLDVTAQLKAGDNVLAFTATNAKPSPAGFAGALLLESGGERRVLRLNDSALYSDRKSEGWNAQAFNDSQWQRVQTLGAVGEGPWGMLAEPPFLAPPLPIFRKRLVIEKPVAYAQLSICGLGQYEATLNGRRVGDREIAPAWTDYAAEAQYDTYDVSSELQIGANAIGVMLGNGFFNVIGGRYAKYTGSFGEPKLICQLHVKFTDGSEADFGSDSSWKSRPGPITFSCVYGGEDFDARKEPSNWNGPDSDENNWRNALEAAGKQPKLIEPVSPPIRVRREFRPQAVRQIRPGVTVYDLGQNFSGRPWVSVRGKTGSVVKIIPAEMVDKAGEADQTSAGGGPTYFSYTLRGEGEETWAPRFSYYGFRYLQVEAPSDVEVLSIKGQFLYSDCQVVGQFTSSNKTLNAIHELILNSIRSNLWHVLTDCPHREKLGWLEVSQLLGNAIMYNFDAEGMYRKICRDTTLSQLENGMVPDIAPEYTVFSGPFRDSPEWGSAAVIDPWLLYRRYGAIDVLKDQYETMRGYVRYLESKSNEGLVSYGLGDWYDIGPNPPGVSQLTSLGVTGTATYYQDLKILRDTAILLDKKNDAEYFGRSMDKVKSAFNRSFFHPDTNSYDRGSQTANAMARVVDLVPEERRSAVVARLAKDVEERGYRVTAGDVGFDYLVRALLEGGRSDVLYKMALQDAGPGYVYQLDHGMTTLAEAWDNDKYSSLNHCMLGHIEEWFYTGLAGIRQEEDSVAMHGLLIAPQPVAGLEWVKASYEGPQGLIVSEWHRTGKRFHLHLVVPPNTTARVQLPGLATAVRLNSAPITQSIPTLAAGTYEIQCELT